MLATPKNITEEAKVDLEELKNLHHLLDGYISILYRLNQESIEGRKFDNWIYNAQSSQGRPDRPRSKLTSAEAVSQLHNLDTIFPLYEKYFNTSRMEDSSSIIADIGERIQNVEVTLAKLEQSIANNGKRNGLKLCALFALIVSIIF